MRACVFRMHEALRDEDGVRRIACTNTSMLAHVDARAHTHTFMSTKRTVTSAAVCDVRRIEPCIHTHTHTHTFTRARA